ncbi:MAG: hypothetical protein ACFE8N_06930 [Promethearchaeota archaeon]
MSRPKYRIKDQARSKTKKRKLRTSFTLIIIFLFLSSAVAGIIIYLSLI